MDRTKDGVARTLADAHFRIEPGLRQIFRLRSTDQVEAGEAEPVKLLEVNPATPRNGIVPVYFAAHPASGIFYPSIIVEIHPEELLAVRQGALPLPHGWRVADELTRPAAEAERVPA
jgi:hypothetical protein